MRDGLYVIMGWWCLCFMVTGAMFQTGDGITSVAPAVWITGGLVFAISVVATIIAWALPKRW